MTAPPRPCQRCARKPVARKTLRYCFDCQPGGPHVPPPCTGCGSNVDYYTAGKCRWCYRGTAAQPAGSCPDCHAWGTMRRRAWVCGACVAWRAKNPTIGNCAICGQRRHLGRGPYCRLCWRTAATRHSAHRRDGSTYLRLDVEAANRHGQQLFIADLTRLAWPRSGHRPLRRQQRSIAAASSEPAPTRPVSRVPGQLMLFTNNPPSFAARHGIPEPLNSRRAQALDVVARELAAHRGWSHTSLKRTRLALTVLLGQHPGPDPIRTSDLGALTALGVHSVVLTRAVLSEAGQLIDDQPSTLQRWFTARIADLPGGMRDELAAWFEVMRHGSATPPRRRPRAEGTIRVQASYALPVIRQWALAGHRSLREISREDVVAALPPGGDRRVLIGSALRSIFVVLRDRKLVFVNPTARMRIGRVESTQPIPVPIDVIKHGLHSDHAVREALTALLSFYALHRREVRALKLTDLRDRHLHVGARVLPVPDPVHDRLTRYLDYRTHRWPRSLNPHLFINSHTAGHHVPVGPGWIRRVLQQSPRALREDRILDEAHARPGDIRRLCDLFDINVRTALRYDSAVEHPDLAETD